MSKAIVIVPTYNEADNIINIIERVLLLSVDFNILVVDDNSPDNTGQLVSKLAINNSITIVQFFFDLLSQAHLGLGQ